MFILLCRSGEKHPVFVQVFPPDVRGWFVLCDALYAPGQRGEGPKSQIPAHRLKSELPVQGGGVS